MAKVKSKAKIVKKNIDSPFRNYWNNSNYVVFGAGIILLIIGFYLMTKGPWDNPISLSVAPIILLIAYLVVFPLAIFYKKRNKIKQN
ncbi:MAG: hypothetical protein V1720_09615 [bacterium]